MKNMPKTGNFSEKQAQLNMRWQENATKRKISK